MKRVLLALCLALGILPALAADEAQAPRDMVVLTVSGMIGKTNRGPLDPRQDSLLALQKVDFPKAFAFDRATLLGLPQGTVKAQPPEFDAPATFTGPLLRELLGYLEAAQVRTTFMAVDGYSGWLDPDDIKQSDWILALSSCDTNGPRGAVDATDWTSKLPAGRTFTLSPCCIRKAANAPTSGKTLRVPYRGR